MDTTDDDLFIGNYVAAFIDILGQRNALAAFSVLPDTSDPQQHAKFVAMLKETLGVVQGIHDICKKFFDGYASPDLDHDIPKEKLETFETMRKMDVRFQRFSDGLVVFHSIANTAVKCPTRAVFGLLGTCGCACLLGLAAKHPIRGGIELGWGAELWANELYGSVIPKAYTLESEVAQYPRIAIGSDLLAYLHSLKNSVEQDIYSRFNKQLAQSCLDVMCVDCDGVVIVDYLGEGFKEHMSSCVEPKVVAAAFRFVLEQLDYWAHRRNTKLVSRYMMLRDYFAARLHVWMDEADLRNNLNPGINSQSDPTLP